MQFLFLLNTDDSLFDFPSVERALHSSPQFTDFRLDDPFGSLIECHYKEPDDETTIRLRGDRSAIVLNETSDTALRAVLLIQKALGRPLRIYNDDYAYDFTFSDLSTVEELEAAMENNRTS